MFVTICGNIGSGKTTVLENLESNGFDVKFEPVHKWTYLSKFYKDMKKYAFSLQMQILKSFLSYTNTNKKVPIVCERSPQESFQVFSSHLYKNNFLELEQFRIIRFFTNTYAWKPDVYIYIRTDPSVCLSRIQSRNRDSENNITLDYIKELHESYDNFSRINKIIHIIDGSKSREDVYNEVRQIMEEIINNRT